MSLAPALVLAVASSLVPPALVPPALATRTEIADVLEDLRRGGDLAVDYVQETITLRGTVRIARGSALFAESGGAFLWRRDQPSSEHWLFNGRELTHYLPESAHATVWPSAAPFAQDLARVAELVRDPDAILAHSLVRRTESVLGDTRLVHLELLPHQDGEFRKLSLLVDASKSVLRAVELHYAAGQITRFTFARERRVRLPAEAFELTARSGVTVDRVRR